MEQPNSSDFLQQWLMNYLKRYAATTGQLRQACYRYLRRKNLEPAHYEVELNRLIQDAISRNWLNDQLLAEKRLEQWRLAGKSRQYIKEKLQHQGINNTEIGLLLEEEEEDSEISAARRFVNRKKLGNLLLNPENGTRKFLQKLAMAGFSAAVSYNLLDEYKTLNEL
ncbi:MAG: regulatory protein RecX [Alphaproteobacteria bacterium]